MKQSYKITFILFLLFILVVLFFSIPTTKHWFYYRMVDSFIDYQIDNISFMEVQPEKTIILDTRNFDEYKVSHLPNAVWIGNDSLFWSRIPQLSDKKTIIVYCSVGYRSNEVGKKIKDSLQLDVKNLKYGIFGWRHNALPLIDKFNNPTNKVHPYNWFWGIWKD